MSASEGSRRHRFWLQAGTAACCIALGGISIVKLFMSHGAPLSYAVFGMVNSVTFGIVAALIVAIPYMVRHSRKIRHLRNADYQLCVSCQYDLRNLPVFGRCPECGSYYDVESTKEFFEDDGTLPWRLRRGLLRWRLRRSQLERAALRAAILVPVLLCVLVAAMIANPLLESADGQSVIDLKPPAALLATSVLLCVLVVAAARRHMRQRVVGAGYLICPACLERLPSTVETGLCESCGLPFSIDAVRATWCDGFLRMPWRLRRRLHVTPKLPHPARTCVNMLMVVFTVGASILLFTPFQPDDRRVWVELAILLVICFLLVGLTEYFIKALCKRVVAQNFFLCLKCHGALPADQDSGNCPGCGQPFVASRVRALWALY